MLNTPEVRSPKPSVNVLLKTSSSAGQSISMPEVELLKRATVDKSVPGGQLLSAIISIEKKKLDVRA